MPSLPSLPCFGRPAALAATLLLATVGLPACAPEPAAEEPAPGACDQLDEPAVYDCVEKAFWGALQQPELAVRKQNEALLEATLARFPLPTQPKRLSLVHFRLGQLRLALTLENQQREYALQSDRLVSSEFRAAAALDPDNGIIPPWLDTMEIAVAAVIEDWVKAKALAERGFDSIARNPLGNILSLSGTTISFPLDTGVPQRTVEYLDKWQCVGAAFCMQNTEHAPFARPGLSFHLGEAYARVGDRKGAQRHFAEALAAPGSESWPYRGVLKAAVDDMDKYMKSFADLGMSGSAFKQVYTNQPYGCLFCHAKPQ